MFSKLTKVSDRKYSIYLRNVTTHVIALPGEYQILRDLKKGDYLYCFFSDFEGKKLLVYSEIELPGAKKIMISTINRSQFRLTVPKIVFNSLEHNEDSRYVASHNGKGFLIFEQTVRNK